MYLHPDSVGVNMARQFPEIFEEAGIEFMHFCIALSQDSARADDYFHATTYLFGSQKTRDLGKLFSAIQRLYGYEYKPWDVFLQEEGNLALLAAATTPKETGQRIRELAKRYYQRDGMRRKIQDFYREYLIETEKLLIVRKMPWPSVLRTVKGGDTNRALKIRLDLLLKFRDHDTHQATYTPLPEDSRKPTYIQIKGKAKEEVHDLPIYLPFSEFYEVTRKAMARFWLEVYKESLKNGRKAVVDEQVRQIRDENRKLNEESGRVKGAVVSEAESSKVSSGDLLIKTTKGSV